MTDLKQELIVSFTKYRNDNGLKTTFNEFQDVLNLTEYVLATNYVHLNIGMQLTHIIQDKLNNYLGLLQSWIFPNQGSYLSMTETNFFSDEKKQVIIKLINQIMVALYNCYLAKHKDDKALVANIDECFALIKVIRTDIIPLYEIGRDGWSKQV